MTRSRQGFPYSRFLRESLASRGLVRTAAQLLRGGYELALDYLPLRRRIRYGDIDFDWDYRVDTTWANVRFATRVRELLTGRQYQPSDPAIFAEMMQALPGGPEGLVFVDLGSGKGRALLLASNYPFRKIVGVELLPELHELAKENIQHYRFDRQRCHDFELYCCDARDYELPREPLLVFLFDPFPEAILGTVVRGIEQSLRQSPRRLIVAYMNPVGEHVLAEAKSFGKVAGTIQWAVYETKL